MAVIDFYQTYIHIIRGEILRCLWTRHNHHQTDPVQMNEDEPWLIEVMDLYFIYGLTSLFSE